MTWGDLYIHEKKSLLCKLIFIPNLAFEFEVPGPLWVPGAGDPAGLLQGLVEACDVLLHLLQRGQQRLGLSQQRQASLSDLIGREWNNGMKRENVLWHSKISRSRFNKQIHLQTTCIYTQDTDRGRHTHWHLHNHILTEKSSPPHTHTHTHTHTHRKRHIYPPQTHTNPPTYTYI